MKKLILFTLMFIASASVTLAQKPAEIKFDKQTHNFGTLNPDSAFATCVFSFTNVGEQPLVVNQAFASCGCTVPEWPKYPILPGESNVIKVTYKNTDRPGSFNKYVTVFSNALVNKEVKLHIKGTVLAQPTDAAPLKIETIGTPVNTTKE